VAALAAVVIQGVLGGLRVVLVQDTLAIVHGAFAHAFFALVAAVTLFTSPGWLTLGRLVSSPNAVRVRRLALYTTVGLYVQILLGTLVTHRGSRLDAHLFAAALVSVAVIILGFRVRAGRAAWPELLRPTDALGALWLLQMVLGLGSYVGRFHGADVSLGPFLTLALPVSHRLVGGLMLIVAVVLTLRAYRRTGWPDSLAGGQPWTGKVPA
jgi:cytochrome c oxidase assembly protein subunit 15